MRSATLVFGIPSVRVVWRATVAAALASMSALSPAATAPAVLPVEWRAHAGAQSDTKSIQALAFFPIDTFVNVGDSITWSFDAAEIHTVSFVPPGQAAPPAGAVSPSNHFDGTHVVNSGILAGPGTSYTVLFDGTGDFTYVCLIHARTMTARVHVNPAGSPYPHTQNAYDRQARDQTRLVLDDGRGIRNDSLDAARDAGPTQVMMGGDAQVFAASFLPQTRRVHVGDTVMWTNPDSITPHTITFGPNPSNAPAGLDTAGHATISSNPVTTTISSGLIGLRRALGTEFAATFTAPGTYPYFCSLHRDLGMIGTIVVKNPDD